MRLLIHMKKLMSMPFTSYLDITQAVKFLR